MQLKTRLVHAGYNPEVSATATASSIMPPLYLTSTFMQEEPGKPINGYEYTRAGNPNFTQLEQLLAAAEGAVHATIFSSGLGAITALLSTLTSGDQVVIIEGVYGGTYRLFTKVFQGFGVQANFVSATQVEAALASKPKILFFETPTNPLLEIADIEKFAALAKQHGVLTVVDNTLATPCLQTPLTLGADVVIHSTTKYIGGHSDAIGGAVVTNAEEVKIKMDFARMALGLNPSPFDAWLIMRGAKTLALRMQAQSENALALAEFLQTQPKVAKVYYPGLEQHPQHRLARKQMQAFGGIVSAELRASTAEIKHS